MSCATKNDPDIHPAVLEIIVPAVTPGHTVVVLVQAQHAAGRAKGSVLEYINIVGAPRAEARRLGVPTPTLDVVHGFCQALQWQFKEARGLVTLPAGAPPP